MQGAALATHSLKETNAGVGSEMVSSGLITKDQLAVAEVTQRTLGGDLTQILIKKGFIQEKDLLSFYAKKMELGVVDLTHQTINPNLLRFVPYQIAKKYTAIPFKQEGKVLTLALADPGNVNVIKETLNDGGNDFEFVIAPRHQIEKFIRDHYQLHKLTNSSSNVVEIITNDNKTNKENQETVQELASAVGTVAAVDSILETAYVSNASDIHIEPQENFIRVRLRIDGYLTEKHILPIQMLLPVVSRIKIVSGMNIAEKRAPQDGRFSVKIRGKMLECRTSTYPTVYGEKVVIRLLSKGSLKKLEQLGMKAEDREIFRSCISKPHGLILVTGPTGSGKSTTLYAALQILNSIDRNIVSIEDPVENEIVGVNQAQVNTKAGVSFASALKSMLRQDPDVIMVGEIRDSETADMVTRAALTGHLVLSTLHTNTAVGAVTRLVNLGIPPFLVSSSLIGVLGQRLVRKICPDCKVEYEPDEAEKKILGLESLTKAFKGAGCEKCNQTGFTSRVGLFELFTMNANLKTLVEKEATEEALLKAAQENGYVPMCEDGRKKIIEGTTTLKEVLRATEM